MRKASEAPVGVIAGTGVAELFDVASAREVRTEYGSASVISADGGRYLVIPRHGPDSSIPPHSVNYRANISALRHLGVRAVISTCAVGSMNRSFAVGRMGVISQFLDFTKTRPVSFFDKKAVHTDMTNPFSARLNSLLIEAGRRNHLEVAGGLVYVCVEGPRYETAAEIRMFTQMGGDVVGMTMVPEVVLANELGMEYSGIAVAANLAAGMQRVVNHQEVAEVMKEVGPSVKSLIVTALRLIGEGKTDVTSR